MRQPHTHASLHLDVTWMFSNIALFGGHSNWYSWPSLSVCILMCWKQSTFSQPWCRWARNKQLKKLVLSKHRLYCTPRDPTSRLFQVKISPLSFKYMALQFTANSQSDISTPFPTLDHTRVPICITCAYAKACC